MLLKSLQPHWPLALSPAVVQFCVSSYFYDQRPTESSKRFSRCKPARLPLTSCRELVWRVFSAVRSAGISWHWVTSGGPGGPDDLATGPLSASASHAGPPTTLPLPGQAVIEDAMCPVDVVRQSAHCCGLCYSSRVGTYLKLARYGTGLSLTHVSHVSRGRTCHVSRTCTRAEPCRAQNLAWRRAREGRRHSGVSGFSQLRLHRLCKEGPAGCVVPCDGLCLKWQTICMLLVILVYYWPSPVVVFVWRFPVLPGALDNNSFISPSLASVSPEISLAFLIWHLSTGIMWDHS